MLSCAILCGGLATRLRPITETIPKSLIGINGEPFIAHQLRLLRAREVNSVVLCTGYLGHMIEDVVGNGLEYGLQIRYSCDGDQLLGTGGAIRRALPLLGSSFFVLYGDSYLDCDYGAVARAFEDSRLKGLMTIYQNEGRYDSSNVEAADGRIVDYNKRNRSQRMKYIDYGLGVFEHPVFAALPANQPSDLADVYRALLMDNQLAAFEVAERFYEIGSVEGIAELQNLLADGGASPRTKL